MYTHTHTGHLGFCFGFLTGKIQSSIKGYNLLKLMTLFYRYRVCVTDPLAFLFPVVKKHAVAMCVCG